MTDTKAFVVRDGEGRSIVIGWDKDRIVAGRSRTCELSYPDDIGLSRQHFALQRIAGQWHVEDLGSKNGTQLNGAQLIRPMVFQPGDRVSAGHISVEYSDVEAGTPIPVEFLDHQELTSESAVTVVQSLDDALGEDGSDGSFDPGRTQVMTGNPQLRALIRAGRELTSHRPLDELFEVIMDLAVDAAGAGRGILMTAEGVGETQEEIALRARATRGDRFRISSTVRDRVLNHKESLLIRDAQMDRALRDQVSIVEQAVHSMIAVPLQTNSRVIGLIYVDTPRRSREFSREDLNLLTVMANVAAIRIEQVRLSAVEEAERAMAKELQQAAIIQQRLLPDRPPKVEGFELAGKTVACKTVGGDYYDFIPYPDGQLAIMVGDVAGKGMPASLLMSSVQARVRVIYEDPGDVSKKMARLNKTTCGNCPDNRFITFFLGIANGKTGELSYSNAGHNPPLLIRRQGGYETLQEGGMILGILPIAPYQEAAVKMERGDILVLFSDGVTEAANLKDEEFGEERLAELVASMHDRSTTEIVQSIHKAVREFAEGEPAADDITVVVARRV